MSNLSILQDIISAIEQHEFENRIRYMLEIGRIDDEFLQWLDDWIATEESSGNNIALQCAFRDEVARLRPISPKLSPDLLSFYETRITTAISSRPADQVPGLVAELKEKGLLTEEFGAVFHRVLDRGVDERQISQLQANFTWEILLDAVGPDMASKIDF